MGTAGACGSSVELLLIPGPAAPAAVSKTVVLPCGHRILDEMDLCSDSVNGSSYVLLLAGVVILLSTLTSAKFSSTRTMFIVYIIGAQLIQALGQMTVMGQSAAWIWCMGSVHSPHSVWHQHADAIWIGPTVLAPAPHALDRAPCCNRACRPGSAHGPCLLIHKAC